MLLCCPFQLNSLRLTTEETPELCASLIISHCSDTREKWVTLGNLAQAVQVWKRSPGVVINITPFALKSSPGWMINYFFSVVCRGCKARLLVIYSFWPTITSVGETGICFTICLIVKHRGLASHSIQNKTKSASFLLSPFNTTQDFTQRLSGSSHFFLYPCQIRFTLGWFIWNPWANFVGQKELNIHNFMFLSLYINFLLLPFYLHIPSS